MSGSPNHPAGYRPKRVMVLGATGTIGRATTAALLRSGHDVTCFLRRPAEDKVPRVPEGATLRFGDVTSKASLREDGFCGERFEALVSCLASRTGSPEDAWAIDHKATVTALEIAKASGVGQVVLLSAICVQAPKLAFQHAKLAAERAVIESGLIYSIVRPTAFFKSLSGQIDRVKRGKPFLVFGDGALTSCKPISDRDLGGYLAGCIADPSRHNRILPIGGPGPAITPMQQAEHLFGLLGRQPKVKRVPVALLDAIIWGLTTLGRVVPSLAAKAELARIGKFYATESMLVLDPATGRYDAEATPSAGSDTLFDYYAQVIRGDAEVERGDHSVF
ncbi:MAG: NAD(P)H-binding protein [Pseudomonadota bacterium]